MCPIGTSGGFGVGFTSGVSTTFGNLTPSLSSSTGLSLGGYTSVQQTQTQVSGIMSWSPTVSYVDTAQHLGGLNGAGQYAPASHSPVGPAASNSITATPGRSQPSRPQQEPTPPSNPLPAAAATWQLVQPRILAASPFPPNGANICKAFEKECKEKARQLAEFAVMAILVAWELIKACVASFECLATVIAMIALPFLAEAAAPVFFARIAIAIRAIRLARAASEATKAATIPRGFASAGDFMEFGTALRSGVAKAGYADTRVAFQGSSVTGVSFRTRVAFDVGRVSDFDIALGGDQIFDAAQELGIELRGGGMRTGPLSIEDLAGLGLKELRDALTALAGRDVKFMIYRSIDDALARSASIVVP